MTNKRLLLGGTAGGSSHSSGVSFPLFLSRALLRPICPPARVLSCRVAAPVGVEPPEPAEAELSAGGVGFFHPEHVIADGAPGAGHADLEASGVAASSAVRQPQRHVQLRPTVELVREVGTVGHLVTARRRLVDALVVGAEVAPARRLPAQRDVQVNVRILLDFESREGKDGSDTSFRFSDVHEGMAGVVDEAEMLAASEGHARVDRKVIVDCVARCSIHDGVRYDLR